METVNAARTPVASRPSTAPLVDPYGRAIRYLRISVTDRCDFRCVYCMSENMTFLPKADVLSFEEIDRLASAFIRRGTTKLRLTGGEPLVRRGIVELVQQLARHIGHGLEEITLTTNGSQLAKYAQPLFDAGMRRINVSLDTLDPDKFAAITRWGRLPQVLEGIAAAKFHRRFLQAHSGAGGDEFPGFHAPGQRNEQQGARQQAGDFLRGVHADDNGQGGQPERRANP